MEEERARTGGGDAGGSADAPAAAGAFFFFQNSNFKQKYHSKHVFVSNLASKSFKKKLKLLFVFCFSAAPSGDVGMAGMDDDMDEELKKKLKKL